MRLRRFKRAAWVGLLSLIGTLIAVPASFAATEQNITISPSSTLVTVAPGGSATKTFTIVNGGSDNFTVDANVAPYHVEGSNYDPQFTQLKGTVDAAAWVTLAQSHFPVASHTSSTVSYTVHAPAGTAPGGYYAVIFAQTGVASDEAQNGVIAHNRVGNILYITVSGPVKNSGNITDVPLPPVFIGTALSIGTKVNNTGGIHFLSSFVTTVHSATGKKVFSSSIDRYVLPQTTRQVDTTWTPTAIMGLYKISRSATVAGVSQSLPDKWVLVIKPQLFPIVGFAVVTAIGLLVILRHERRTHRHPHESDHHDEKP